MQSGTYRYPPMERVVFGKAFDAVLKEEVERASARAVYVLMSGTLARNSDAEARVRSALADRFAGISTKIGAHTPRVDVVEAANAARARGADLILTVGGGSVTDGGKMVGLCLGNGVSSTDQLDACRATLDAESRIKPPGLPQIAIPTTLSAGEFTALAGCTDTRRGVKELFTHPQLMPRAVILDPAATVWTPEWLFLSTGIRAVDHAVEDLCSIESQPLSDAASTHALTLLGRGLKRVKTEPQNLDARLDCQIGAWLSVIGSQTGVSKGASHGIGHVLGGTAHVPHGYTSCVMLPHVLRFNRWANAERQARVAAALGSPGGEAADAVAALVAALGLPSRLSEVGVKREDLDRIARLSMHDRWIHTNPRKIDGPEVIRSLLEAAF
jgi:maleylacetate reductase